MGIEYRFCARASVRDSKRFVRVQIRGAPFAKTRAVRSFASDKWTCRSIFCNGEVFSRAVQSERFWRRNAIAANLMPPASSEYRRRRAVTGIAAEDVSSQDRVRRCFPDNWRSIVDRTGAVAQRSVYGHASIGALKRGDRQFIRGDGSSRTCPRVISRSRILRGFQVPRQPIN